MVRAIERLDCFVFRRTYQKCIVTGLCVNSHLDPKIGNEIQIRTGWIARETAHS